MTGTDIYRDISTRTDGDIYIGVVGPVRTGKSTFIKKFMEALVIPNIDGEDVYKRQALIIKQREESALYGISFRFHLFTCIPLSERFLDPKNILSVFIFV